MACLAFTEALHEKVLGVWIVGYDTRIVHRSEYKYDQMQGTLFLDTLIYISRHIDD